MDRNASIDLVLVVIVNFDGDGNVDVACEP
jgi:hypothetical protein